MACKIHSQTLAQAVMAALLLACSASAFAQNQPAAGPLPEYAGQVMLIKNALTALNHGSITGNYTVLRDLASERFRQTNTAGSLAGTFANLRSQRLDLSPILIFDPQLTQRPALDERGRLRLEGFFPTQPKAVKFLLVYQQTPAGWVIDDITVGVVPLENRAPPARPEQASRSAPPETPRAAAYPQRPWTQQR